MASSTGKRKIDPTTYCTGRSQALPAETVTHPARGVSINLTAELDSALLGHPGDLQREVANLYAQAELALDRQASAGGDATAKHSAHALMASGDSCATNMETRAMTPSQRKAIQSIARQADLDPSYEAQQIIGTPLDQLTLRQASELIDHLKEIGQGRGR